MEEALLIDIPGTLAVQSERVFIFGPMSVEKDFAPLTFSFTHILDLESVDPGATAYEQPPTRRNGRRVSRKQWCRQNAKMRRFYSKILRTKLPGYRESIR